MIKALPALAIAAFIALALTILPSFAPNVEAGVPHALAKGDKLLVMRVSASCAEQHWPNIDASCLKRSNSTATIPQVRLVTTDRR